MNFFEKNPCLRFGLVGLGRIAKRYGQLLSSEIKDAKLVAACDVKKDRRDFFSKEFNVATFSNIEEMISKNKLDVICILTPSGIHAENAMEVCGQVKNIIIEKPMTLKLEDAKKLIKLSQEKKSRIFVVKQNRFNLPIIKLKEAIDQNRFGKLVMGSTRVRWCRRQDYYNQDKWRGTFKYDGGVLANQASHHIDLLDWLMGGIKSVCAFGSHQLSKIQAEDTAVVLLEYKNGATGTIEATTATRPKDTEGSISILGEFGLVEVGGFAANQLKTWQFEKENKSDKIILSEFSENPPDVYGFGHRRYLENVISSILNNKPALVSGVDGLRSVKLLNALYESMATGKKTRVDSEKFSNSKLGK